MIPDDVCFPGPADLDLEPGTDPRRRLVAWPRGNRLAAWASEPGRPTETRNALEARFAAVVARFAEGEEVPRPPGWGGDRIVARSVELWAGRPNRLHDRARFTRGTDGQWRPQRLMP